MTMQSMRACAGRGRTGLTDVTAWVWRDEQGDLGKLEGKDRTLVARVVPLLLASDDDRMEPTRRHVPGGARTLSVAGSRRRTRRRPPCACDVTYCDCGTRVCESGRGCECVQECEGTCVCGVR